jgi:hypothetical protein
MAQDARASRRAESAKDAWVDLELSGQDRSQGARDNVPPFGPFLDLERRLEPPFQLLQPLPDLDQPDKNRGRLLQAQAAKERRLEPELVRQRLAHDPPQDVAAVGPVGRLYLLACLRRLRLDQTFALADVEQRVGGHDSGQLRQLARLYRQLPGQLVSQGAGDEVAPPGLVVVTQGLLGVLGNRLGPQTPAQLGQLGQQDCADFRVYLTQIVSLDA